MLAMARGGLPLARGCSSHLLALDRSQAALHLVQPHLPPLERRAKLE
jgi:hypothetical protein